MFRAPHTHAVLVTAGAFAIAGSATIAALTLTGSPAATQPPAAPAGATSRSEWSPDEINGTAARKLAILKAQRAAEFDACHMPHVPARPC